MINYGIVMRSVNSNLLEINQAKARINQAKADGKTPDPKDEALAETETKKAYAIAQYSDVMSIEQLAKHISSHGCVYSRADISAILYMAVDCMREMLLDGKKLCMGDLGDFSVSLVSKGAEKADKFFPQNITDVKVVWEAGSLFKNLINEAEFNLVASRAAQAALIKAVREGRDTVDLTTGGSSTGEENDGEQTQTVVYTLMVSSANEDQGSVNPNGSTKHNKGSKVAVKATAKQGFAFDKWSDGNTQAQRTITMDKDYTLVASFKTAPSAGGSEEVDGGDESFEG